MPGMRLYLDLYTNERSNILPEVSEGMVSMMPGYSSIGRLSRLYEKILSREVSFNTVESDLVLLSMVTINEHPEFRGERHD